ncbi:MAG: energy transducer TonB [Bacteroidota bacterium]
MLKHAPCRVLPDNFISVYCKLIYQFVKQKKNRPDNGIKPPVFPGGKKALDEHIRTSLRYPEEALKNKVQGTVSVDYDVDVFGNVTRTQLKHGIGYGCDEEAIRLVNGLKYAKRKYQGMHVVFHLSINIHFRLPQAPPPPSQQTITYHIKIEKPPGGEQGLGYTIKIN